MCAKSGISPALSKLEIRIKSLKMIQDSIKSYEYDILRYYIDIESINLKLEELRADEHFNKSHIETLLDEARKEGFDDAYLERFLKESHCKLDK